MILYQYAPRALFNDVLHGKNPVSFEYWNPSDKTPPQGWYFTDISPRQCNVLNLAFCWRNVYAFTKNDCYLMFDVPEQLLEGCGEHLHHVSSWDQRIRLMESGETPKCTRGPCLMCENIPKVKKLLRLG